MASPSARSWTESETSRIQEALARVLASAPFAQSERQRRFLQYIVTETLAGRGDKLKGYALGVHVFDRDPHFDPAIDSIVRVEAARLRWKLQEYYAGEGAREPVRIALPKGGYAATFDLAGPRPEGSGVHGEREESGPPRGAGERPSLAVLPFRNLSADADQEYFADGISEDLITELSKLPGLTVIARHSSFAHKGSAKRIEDIGGELGVRYVLDGSVRRAGERVRVAAQLVDAVTGGQVWAERYDREFRDVFALQDEISRGIAAALAVRLAPAQTPLGHEGTSSLEAYECLLRGLERFWIYTPEANAEAAGLFRRAVELDPAYAAAHAWLARSHAFRFTMPWLPGSDEALDAAEIHARRAVGLDARLPLGHTMAGWVALWRRDGEASLAAGRRAVALDPNNADAHMYLSITLSALDRGEEALRQMETVMRLNPHPSALNLFGLGMCYMVLGRYEDAAGAFRQSSALRPTFVPSHVLGAVVQVLLGQEEAARHERDIADALTGGRGPVTRLAWLAPDLRERFAAATARAGIGVTE